MPQLFTLKELHKRSIVVACAICIFSTFASNVMAQNPGADSPASAESLNIEVIQGDSAGNNLGYGALNEPVVQVLDENHRPVAGASVSFATIAGEAGAGASFGSEPMYTTVTDEAGKAEAHGFEPNHIAGDYKIRVVAKKGSRSAFVLIQEKNLVKAARIAAGGAGGGILSNGTADVLIAGAASSGAVVGLLQIISGNQISAAPAKVSGIPATPIPTSVPEIDPSMAFGCLILLAGSVAVLRGR